MMSSLHCQGKAILAQESLPVNVNVKDLPMAKAQKLLVLICRHPSLSRQADPLIRGCLRGECRWVCAHLDGCIAKQHMYVNSLSCSLTSSHSCLCVCLSHRTTHTAQHDQLILPSGSALCVCGTINTGVFVDALTHPKHTH
jgi:hypothetical protein